jgi:hypothetical protein
MPRNKIIVENRCFGYPNDIKLLFICHRGINYFKKGYQPRSNLAREENGDLLADSHILNRWKNYYSQ